MKHSAEYMGRWRTLKFLQSWSATTEEVPHPSLFSDEGWGGTRLPRPPSQPHSSRSRPIPFTTKALIPPPKLPVNSAKSLSLSQERCGSRGSGRTALRPHPQAADRQSLRAAHRARIAASGQPPSSAKNRLCNCAARKSMPCNRLQPKSPSAQKLCNCAAQPPGFLVPRSLGP